MAQRFPRLSIEDAFRDAEANAHETRERVAAALAALEPKATTKAGLICLAGTVIALLVGLAMVPR